VRSIVREISIGGENYRTKYNSRPLRHFGVFERHNSVTSADVRLSVGREH
jgi:hypothetical protein